jgi:Domain of unknown function (DUF4191)
MMADRKPHRGGAGGSPRPESTQPRAGKGAAAGKLSAADAKKATAAAKKAEKARKKASNDPADMGRIRQIIRAYQLTHEYDKRLPFWLIGAFLLPIAVGLGISIFWHHPIYLGFLGLMTGLLLSMLVLARRAKAATYRRYAGQAGSAEVALQMLPKAWISTPAIAANRNRDVVHRTVGPGGLVLIGEGEPGRVRQLLTSEVKKHERVAYGITVTTVVMGEKQGQVPLAQLAEHIKKLPKVLQPHQVTDLKQRLRALDAVRPPVPVPKGPLPTSARQVKGARQAMRGR